MRFTFPEDDEQTAMCHLISHTTGTAGIVKQGLQALHARNFRIGFDDDKNITLSRHGQRLNTYSTILDALSDALDRLAKLIREEHRC